MTAPASSRQPSSPTTSGAPSNLGAPGAPAPGASGEPAPDAAAGAVPGQPPGTAASTAQDTSPGEPSGAGGRWFAPASSVRRVGDRVFSLLTCGSGLIIVALVALVGLFLLAKAIPAISDDNVNFLTSRQWNVSGTDLRFGILDLLWVTVIASLLAMLIALPVAVGVALFITFYAPRRLARPAAHVIDLLAAVPSIIYGIWGIYVLAPKLSPIRTTIQDVLGWIPLFSKTSITTGTIFVGAIVLAIMILPIITAISREVFERTPRATIEAAWALGSTRWEMVRLAALPHGRPGVISGAMLGLGRALGETIAVTLILSKMGEGAPFSWSIFNGGETFAAKIANNAAEFSNPNQTGAYIAAGLVLFILTFAVNAAARLVINRRKDFV